MTKKHPSNQEKVVHILDYIPGAHAVVMPAIEGYCDQIVAQADEMRAKDAETEKEGKIPFFPVSMLIEAATQIKEYLDEQSS
tara:strand:+ start:292 stop:537 length:246 start_codon:yes stop_codon:yes gene_type:complete